MQSLLKIVLCAILVTSVTVSAYPADSKLRRDGQLGSTTRIDPSSLKLRRDAQYSLYPFPRVGRAPRNTWMGPASGYTLYAPYAKAKADRVAYPRIGRSGISNAKDSFSDNVNMPQEQSSDSSGMWFGPRLGRAFNINNEGRKGEKMYAAPRIGRSENYKDSYLDDDLNMPREQHSDSSGMWFGPRIGRSFYIDSNGNPQKQNTFVPGPRIGRRGDYKNSYLDDDLNMPQEQHSDSSGMWFGPRIGRSFIDDNDAVMLRENNDRSDPEQMESTSLKERKKK